MRVYQILINYKEMKTKESFISSNEIELRISLVGLSPLEVAKILRRIEPYQNLRFFRVLKKEILKINEKQLQNFY